MAEDSVRLRYHEPTSKFAAEVPNPFRPGKQYKVFEFLRLGFTRAGLIAQVESTIESRDHRALLDTVLHRTKKKNILVTGGSDGEPYHLLPGEGYEAVRSSGPSKGAVPTTAGSQPEAGERHSRTGPDECAAAGGDALREPIVTADDVTLEDITYLYEAERRGH